MRNRNLHRQLAIGIVAAVLVPAAVSCRQAGKTEAGAAAAFGATPVKVFKAHRERISERLTYTGTIEAWRKINITPEVGGKIARIHVQEGDRVAEGRVLAELETESLRLQLKQAEAGLAVTEAGYLDAERNKVRMDRLLEEKAVSEMQHEKARLAFDAAAAQLDQARAALNLARYALDVSIMKAPFAGVIGSKNAEVGDVINPMMSGFGSASGVLTLMDDSRIKVIAGVSSLDIGRLRKGQEAVLRSPSLPGREFSGEVTVVNQTADPLSKKFGVEAVFANPARALRPGTFGEVIFEVRSHENALIIPQRAVLSDTHVFVVEAGRAVRKSVSLGLQNATMVEVLAGLEEGAAVIADGNYGLEEGAEVEVLEEVKK
jgi:RND family efflux transporter MFP subunit